MKKYLFLVATLFLQVFWASHEVCAMDSSSYYDQPESERNVRLIRGISGIFGKNVEIEYNGGFIKFTGSQEACEEVRSILGNFDKLRETIIPVSGKVTTQAYAGKQFENWGDCVRCLGINPDDLKLFAIEHVTDKDNRLYIPCEGVDENFAIAYISAIKKKSPFFELTSTKNKDLIQHTKSNIIINYRIFTEYFCDAAEQKYGKENNHVTLTLPLESILKKIIIAGGAGVSAISLEKTDDPDQFNVRTVTLGKKTVKHRPTATLVIAIDRSKSMEGKPIQAINKEMPKLLEQLKGILKNHDSLNVNVFAFDNDITDVYSQILTSGCMIPEWKNISIKSGTDLTHIGKLCQVKEGDNKIVIAFTDGEHKAGQESLEESYNLLTKLKDSGSFAQTYLCKVAKGSKPNDYFTRISQISGGFSFQEDTIDGFYSEVLSKIPPLLVLKENMVLTLKGERVVIWQENSLSDIHITKEVVRSQDSIMHEGATYTVDISTDIPTSEKIIEVKSEEIQESEEAKIMAEMAKLQERLRAIQTGSKTC